MDISLKWSHRNLSHEKTMGAAMKVNKQNLLARARPKLYWNCLN